MTKIHELAKVGQSVWLDFISRSLITSGELKRLIDIGLRGVTSNPTIFQKAISGSSDYTQDLERLVASGSSPQDVFLSLAVDDIRATADLLRPVYDQTGGKDGFVSLEVNPALANDTQATIDEATRLWQTVDRPNLMVKIPATLEGLPAIAEATARGVNVNITLIFSLFRYADVMASYLRGLDLRLQEGKPIDHIASVASFFVSRVDTKVDKRLEQVIKESGDEHAKLAKSLRGQAAVANAKMAYRQFIEVFLEGETFAHLKNQGANLQRPLWASTSTKNPDYSDIKYVQELIAPHTVNTLPQDTLDAFLDHGEVRPTLMEGSLVEPEFVLQSLDELGIHMEDVTRELEIEGVASFAESYNSLLETIEEKVH